jgi:hypothetical protein
MVFTSHIFVFYFLPLVLAGYYALPARSTWRNAWLLLTSYLFYGWWNPWFVLLMFFVTTVNYACGRLIARPGATARQRRAAVTAAIVVSLGLLCFFKYCGFFQTNLNHVLAAFGAGGVRVWRIILPIGISFYIFHALSYAIDVYRGVAPAARSFADFACYIALFPQSIAGPIIRYNTIAHDLRDRSHHAERFASGVALFILGFAKKVLLANPIGRVADAAFGAQTLDAPAAWCGVLAYALQIYFDFAGYSDMAVGLGRMFGFEFQRNFNAPYHADSITDFWRRWHLCQSRHRDVARRFVARRELDLRRLGRVPRRAAHCRALGGPQAPLPAPAASRAHRADFRSRARFVGLVPRRNPPGRAGIFPRAVWRRHVNRDHGAAWGASVRPRQTRAHGHRRPLPLRPAPGARVERFADVAEGIDPRPRVCLRAHGDVLADPEPVSLFPILMPP